MQAVSEYILRKTKLYRYVDHAGCIRVYLNHVQDEIRILSGYMIWSARYPKGRRLQWAWWCLKSPASQLFAQLVVQAQIKENIKALCHWSLWGETSGFPSQRASNFFHLMMSSWAAVSITDVWLTICVNTVFLLSSTNMWNIKINEWRFEMINQFISA